MENNNFPIKKINGTCASNRTLVIKTEFCAREPNGIFKRFTPKESVKTVYEMIAAAENENAKASRMATRYVAKRGINPQQRRSK